MHTPGTPHEAGRWLCSHYPLGQGCHIQGGLQGSPELTQAWREGGR